MDKDNSRAIAVVFLSLLILIGTHLTPAEKDLDTKNINVMSLNIRFNNPGDGENAWPRRKEMVAETLRFHKVDIAGLQEALHDQVKALEALLPEYGWFGVGRDDGQTKGEYSPVLYRKDRFKVISQSTFWLSETPEKPGKIGWDAVCTRIVTWGKIEDKLTKTVFFAFNTHFDHVGQTARVKSAELLLKKIQELAENEPIILTGDFNCTEKNSPYKILTSGAGKLSGFDDTYFLSKSKHYGSTQTFNGFQTEIKPSHRIDFIFVRNTGKVLRHGIIAERWDGRFVSDHNAVLSEIEFPCQPER